MEHENEQDTGPNDIQEDQREDRLAPRKRKSYTLQEKLNAIRRLETEFKGNKSEAERKTGIGRTILIGWAKNRKKLLEQSKKRNRARLPGGGRGPKYPLLETAMKAWFQGERNPPAGQPKRPVSWRRFRMKALELAAQSQYKAQDCRCSERFIWCFMRRHNLSTRAVTHRAQEDNRPLSERQEIMREFLDAARLKTVGVDDSHIINMDETPVYVDMASNRTMTFAGNVAF